MQAVHDPTGLSVERRTLNVDDAKSVATIASYSHARSLSITAIFRRPSLICRRFAPLALSPQEVEGNLHDKSQETLYRRNFFVG